MTHSELALLLGKTKGIEKRKLLMAAKPILQLMSGTSNPKKDKINESVINSITDSNTTNKKPRIGWVDEDEENQTPSNSNADKYREPFIPNQNDVPFTSTRP